MKLNLKKSLVIISLIFIVLFLSGCADMKESWAKTKARIKGEEITIEKKELNDSCPECICEECGEDLDGVIPYWDEQINEGLYKFIENSHDYLFCVFTRLDIENFNNLFLEKYSDDSFNLKIIFDQDSTMDCTSACIPRTSSQYNYLFGEGLDLETRQNIHENFCVNEQAVFITSKIFDDQDRFDFGMLLKSSGLQKVYKRKFTKIHGDM